ncbi:MAG: recombinase family protein [Burkholderiaceae bacterium]|nr:recombinase family protein [Burkholderiaceae bacterium]
MSESFVSVPTFVSYIRVSTGKQHQSGLGEEAQRIAVANYVRSKGGHLMQEIQETQSGRKSLAKRPELARALALCKRAGAVLVIGKVDRLARDVRQFIALIDDSGVDIRFADMPDVCPHTDEGRMLLLSMANFAEFEGRRIGTRTKAAIAAKKRRVEVGCDEKAPGITDWKKVWGVAGAANLRQNIEERRDAANAFAAKLHHTLAGFQARGLTQRQMVAELNAVGIKTARGGEWSLVQVQRVLARLKGTPLNVADVEKRDAVWGSW